MGGGSGSRAGACSPAAASAVLGQSRKGCCTSAASCESAAACTPRLTAAITSSASALSGRGRVARVQQSSALRAAQPCWTACSLRLPTRSLPLRACARCAPRDALSQSRIVCFSAGQAPPRALPIESLPRRSRWPAETLRRGLRLSAGVVRGWRRGELKRHTADALQLKGRHTTFAMSHPQRSRLCPK